MAVINLYAELLLNIRQLTILVTLPTTSNDTTRVELSPDQRSLSIFHDGKYTAVNLPCKAASSSVTMASASNIKELSFRLPITHDNRAEGYNGVNNSGHFIWPASALSSTTKIACRCCKNVVVKRGITSWKDLPSENWAEMMDFWHCHKPHVKEDGLGADSTSKGYAASNVCIPKPGIGFVDDLHLLLASNDCVGLEVSHRYSSYKMLHFACLV